MDNWINGELYVDLLSLLNDLEVETVIHPGFEAPIEKAWIFDLCYKRMYEDSMEVKVSFINKTGSFYNIKSTLNVETTNITDLTSEIISSSSKLVDSVTFNIIESYLANCLRDVVAVSMSKDILSPYGKDITFDKKWAETRLNHCTQWFSAMEEKHKAE